MAKYFNNRVKTGKLAGSVFAIRNGETIERAYQPIVANPNTPAQIATRAKLKLLSQLSAVMADVIAIPRQGSASSRNMFTKKNYQNIAYDSGAQQATVTLTSIQLTNGVLPIGDIANIQRGEGSINIALQPNTTSADISRVVYIQFRKVGDSLEFAGSAIATSAGSNNQWPGTMPATNAEIVVYAYGVRANTENARVVFGDMEAPTAETIARLLVTRTLTENDVTLTKTVAKISAAVQSRDEDGDESQKKGKK